VATEHEALVERLRSLRELSWDRPDHRRSLEERIMREGTGSTRRWRWLTAKAALFVGVVVMGGVAAGATTMWLVSEAWVEPGTSDGQGNCTWIVHDADGTTQETEMLPEDSAWISIDDDDGGSTSSAVGKVDDPVATSAAGATAAGR